MKKLTIELDCPPYNKELKDYLLSQEGINNYEYDIDKDILTVTYDSKKTSPKIIKQYIFLFLDIKIPTILSFSKETNSNYSLYTITIKDLCCEYCLKSTIEDLFDINGIISAKSDFDFINQINVKIFIKYDENIISKKEILDLEKEINETM